MSGFVPSFDGRFWVWVQFLHFGVFDKIGGGSAQWVSPCLPQSRSTRRTGAGSRRRTRRCPSGATPCCGSRTWPAPASHRSFSEGGGDPLRQFWRNGVKIAKNGGGFGLLRPALGLKYSNPAAFQLFKTFLGDFLFCLRGVSNECV